MSLLARTVGRFTWLAPGRIATRLHRFALAEQGSMIDLTIAARLTQSPTRAAAYLAHAGDEARHARMFETQANEWASRAGIALALPRADVEHLFETLGEVGFLALVHRGERSGLREFEVYRDQFARRGEPRTALVFDAILPDERRHEATSWAMLVEVSGSEAQARRALRSAAMRAAWRSWLRAGRTIGRAVYVVLTAMLYLLCAPLALAVRIARPTPRGSLRAP